MKTIGKYIPGAMLILAFIAVLTVGCGDKFMRERIVSSQEITVGAAESSMILTVDTLVSAIAEVVNTSVWLTFEIQPYTEGAPQVKLSWTENNKPHKRKTTALLTTIEDDQITLTVIQDLKTEMDDIHGTTTDKPAYSPVR